MADKKISELDSQTGAQTADDDVFVIADVSANVTKKITLSELDNALAARDFNFGDNTKLLMGDSNDLEIFHNASDSIINDAGTGSLKLQTGGSTKLEVTSGGVTVTGSVTGSLTGNADSATQVYVTDPDPDTDADHYILGVASTSSGNKAVVLDGGVYFNPSLNRLYSNSIFLTGAPTSNGFVGFEGATSDSFETFLFATDPTADRAIYLPDLSGTLTVTGASQNVSFGTLTADGGISVDNITIDGTEIDLSSGDLTLDVAGDIILDADGGDVKLKDNGASKHTISMQSNGDTYFVNETADADILFRGVDGSSTITALTLDMSQAGEADFNCAIKVSNQIVAHQTNRGVLEYNSNITRLRSYGASAGTGELRFQTGGGGGNADSLAMTINSSGNVGIADNSPPSRLTVLGDNSAAPASNGAGINGIQVTRTTSSSENLYIYTAGNFTGWSGSAYSARIEGFGVNALEIGTRGSKPVVFATDNTARMQVDSSGDVQIGSTSSGGATTNFVKVTAGHFTTANGRTTVASTGVATTLHSFASNQGNFLISVFASGTGNIEDNTTAILHINNTATRLTTLVAGSRVVLSMSSLNLQVTQSIFGGANIDWSVMRIR